MSGLYRRAGKQAVARQVYPNTIARHDRWIKHYENRLSYERAMLGESGGIATDQKQPEKGGACKCGPRGMADGPTS